MARGGRREGGTWPKGQDPPFKKQKGTKHRSTKLKEALGLENWDGLKSYIENEGATKLITEMQKLTGKDYVTAISAMTEFVKPKLQRIDATVKTDENVTISFTE